MADSGIRRAMVVCVPYIYPFSKNDSSGNHSLCQSLPLRTAPVKFSDDRFD